MPENETAAPDTENEEPASSVLEEIPEDLASLTSADDVLALAGRIEQRMREIAADAAADPSAVTELELLADAYRDLNTRATEIADEAAERARRAEAALAVLAPEPTASDTPPEQAPPAPPEPSNPQPEQQPAPQPEPQPQPQPEPAPAPVQAAAEIQAPSTEMSRRMTASERRNAIAELRNRQNAPGSRVPAAPSAALSTGNPDYPMRASRPLPNMQAGDPFQSAEHLAQMTSELRRRMGRMQLQGRGFEYVGQMTEQTPENLITVEDDPVHNFVVLDNLQQDLLGRNSGRGGSNVDTLVASGALCAPFAPLYEFFRLAQPQNPVERSLPTVQAPRGGIRFIVPPDFRPARAGIGTRNSVQNADPTTPDKPCVTVACPGVNDCVVQAVTECVRWDNLNFRAFPEQVAAFTADLAVNFAAVKETLYLTAIDSASTAVTSAVPAYGAHRAYFWQLAAASAGYRKRNGMLMDATLVLYAPSWLYYMLVADYEVDPHEEEEPEVDIPASFAAMNLAVVWYNDAPGASATNLTPVDTGQAFRGSQAAGALNLWPTTAVSYLHAPGTFIRLDAGSLDVGLVRDSALNATNDLELFMEQWIGICMVGLESIKLTSTLCANGVSPNYGTALTCP